MIDRETVQKIKETANVVDVVSDFVTLRRSGSNFKGLCPFHNEKTPSFFVSPSRGIYHCFGCGKGGDSVSFIMEYEQLTYPEALRWLANKYHIEIQEHELTDKEKREQSERESMFIVNQWASDYFEHLLRHDEDGIAIGLQYFRSRGFRDDIIKKFKLGYDAKDRFLLSETALKEGYKEQFLTATGLCYKNDRGELIDRFSGRVIFPWFGISGKIVGFGGRVLDSRTKGVNMKYVNSPDSEIYHKDRELYGIFQAKRAIAKADRVYMVEGYTDVISMHQCGIENVVANSGTALSEHQIHLLHRFTSNITLIYDGDEAGIHAALRGTDMLLGEGMNLKVLLLPDKEDPDSFARKHNAEDFRKYIDGHQTDFIEFKTNLLLKNETDPIKRAQGINSIVRSISVVTNQILRDFYLKDVAGRTGINEVTLINTMNGFIRNRHSERQREAQRAGIQPEVIHGEQTVSPRSASNHANDVERLLIQLIVREGEKVIYDNVESEQGNTINLTVAQTIDYSLETDGLKFNHPVYNKMMKEAVEHCGEKDFKATDYFLHHEDEEVSMLANSLYIDRYQITLREETSGTDKYVDQAQKAAEEQLNLRNRTEHLLLDFKKSYIEKRLREIQSEITQATDEGKRKELMREYVRTHQIRNALAEKLGNSIIT